MNDESSGVTGSVSLLIANMKDGDDHALAKLYQRYWPRLVNIARSRLKGAPLRHVDEEDVAQSALLGFYNTVRDRKAAQLQNRDQLLALLSHIIACKAVNQIQKAMAHKRGRGGVRELTPLTFLVADESTTASQEALLKDCYEQHVHGLGDDLRPFAEMHLAGYSNAEIAAELNCVDRTVERKLALLRAKWRRLADEEISE